MTDARRQLILSTLIERVSVIRVANGYQTDAGATLFIGETPPLGPDDPAAALAIVVGDEEPLYQGEQLFIRLPYDIQALANPGLEQPWLVVEATITDIKRAVELADRTLGGLVKRQIERRAVRSLPREPGTETIGAAVTYVAPYTEKWGDP